LLPPVSQLQQDDTHRLIPSRNTDESVLNRLTSDHDELEALFELEGATNERLQGEAGLLPGIGLRELVFGLTYAHIVNAAFTHAHPLGSRFNGPDRGAWYGSFDLETSAAEVAFHKAQELREIGWQETESFVYLDFLADFRGEFHDIRKDARFRECLDPTSYSASQRLAHEMLNAGAAGIVYPSVRYEGGTCIACFRPALVNNVRRGPTMSITFANAFASPVIKQLSRHQ
jgi:hypothetical protein